MIRAVLDANVFVSAILNPKGSPAKLLLAWYAEKFQLVVSEAIVEEISRVLHYPKIAKRHQWSEEKIKDFLASLTYLAIQTPGKRKLNVIKDDPSDNRYLECALEGGAAYIVSGDRDLLDLGEYEGIRILTPSAFLTILK